LHTIFNETQSAENVSLLKSGKKCYNNTIIISYLRIIII